ncbi:MAG: hypothetical protein ACYDFT_02750 [Thermoplasmata archaeon]
MLRCRISSDLAFGLIKEAAADRTFELGGPRERQNVARPLHDTLDPPDQYPISIRDRSLVVVARRCTAPGRILPGPIA